MIPIDERLSNMLSMRQYLQRYGQLERKDFMLSDRVNWPQFPFPRERTAQQMYTTNTNPRQVPQQMAYPPHAAQGPPLKRARHVPAHPNQHAPQMGGGPHSTDSSNKDNIDEEDISRGDAFDIVTPRDLANHRYKKNHEWMEEIMSSAYRLGQIIPPGIGLGFKGPLAHLTDGIFPAHGSDALKTELQLPAIGPLDKAKADDFRERVEQHLKSEQAEIERMKEAHAKTMAKFKANSLVNHAEKEIRTAVDESGTEVWRIEGMLEDSEDGGNRWTQKHHKTLDEIVAQVENHLGKKVTVLRDVCRMQEGGYQEPAPEPIPEPVVQQPQDQAAAPDQGAGMSRGPSQAGSQHSGVMIGDSDIDMGNTAASLLDQMHGGFSSTSTPLNSFPTPQPQLSSIQSSAPTPANLNVPSPAPAQPVSEPTPVQVSTSEDTAMGNTDQVKEGTTTADQDTGSGDWVVVPKGGVSPDPAATTPAALPAAPELAKPATDGGSMAFDGDHNDFSSLGDLDTAGEALAGYDAPALDGSAGELGDGLDLHMDLEDSAFGDAYHGVGSTDTPAGHSEGI
jgi:hypothetical protein